MTPKQMSLSMQQDAGFERQRKPTRRDVFLAEIPPRQTSCRPDRIHPGGEGTGRWLDTDKHSGIAQ